MGDEADHHVDMMTSGRWSSGFVPSQDAREEKKGVEISPFHGYSDKELIRMVCLRIRTGQAPGYLVKTLYEIIGGYTVWQKPLTEGKRRMLYRALKGGN